MYNPRGTGRQGPSVGAIEDILDWSSTKLPPWRQDALRRLACQAALAPSDVDHILNLIKESVGFQLAVKPAAAVPLEKVHFSSAAAGVPLQLKSIRNVENVNRLRRGGQRHTTSHRCGPVRPKL